VLPPATQASPERTKVAHCTPIVASAADAMIYWIYWVRDPEVSPDPEVSTWAGSFFWADFLAYMCVRIAVLEENV
jgi:hypothetical protein